MSKLIVVIEDSPTVQKILEITLSRKGYSPISFADPREALTRMVHDKNFKPHLLIVDLGLEYMDGYEVIRYVRQRLGMGKRTLPIIILSRRDGVIDRLKGKLAGANEYLTKPFQTGDIINTVQLYLPSPN